MISLNVVYVLLNILGHFCFKQGKGIPERFLSVFFSSLMFLQESPTGQSNDGLTKLLMERWIKVFRQVVGGLKLSHGKVWDNYPKVYRQKKVLHA